MSSMFFERENNQNQASTYVGPNSDTCFEVHVKVMVEIRITAIIIH